MCNSDAPGGPRKAQSCQPDGVLQKNMVLSKAYQKPAPTRIHRFRISRNELAPRSSWCFTTRILQETPQNKNMHAVKVERPSATDQRRYKATISGSVEAKSLFSTKIIKLLWRNHNNKKLLLPGAGLGGSWFCRGEIAEINKSERSVEAKGLSPESLSVLSEQKACPLSF